QRSASGSVYRGESALSGERASSCRITCMRPLFALVARADVSAPVLQRGTVVFRSHDIWAIAAAGGALFVSVTGPTLRIDAAGQQRIADFPCSHLATDGKWLYCGRNNEGVSRMPTRGGASEVISSQGGFSGLAVDTRFLYLFGVGGIWRMPKSGGTR